MAEQNHEQTRSTASKEQIVGDMRYLGIASHVRMHYSHCSIPDISQRSDELRSSMTMSSSNRHSTTSLMAKQTANRSVKELQQGIDHGCNRGMDLAVLTTPPVEDLRKVDETDGKPTV